jgi:early B-cell factor
MLVSSDPDEVSFDHNFARLERLLRAPEDPEDIPKDMLLRRAADALEAFYSIPRTQQHMAQPNHGCFPTYYPRSPAIFTPLFTPQFKSPGFSLVSPNKSMYVGEMEHKEEGSSGNYPSNPVSRCNSNEAISQGQGNMEAAFVFPQVQNHDSASQLPPSSIQKPKAIPPSPMTAPMYPMAAMPYLHYAAAQHMQHQGFPKVEPGTGHYLNHSGEEGGNRNNNNSVHQGVMPLHMGGQHPVSFVPPMVPGSPSHGYIMTGAHSVSPGPIAAATPGAQAFTFSAGVMNSPNKALRGGVALQSPQFGTFLFPPTTPTGLIAPISLPDLTAPSDSTPSTSSTTTGIPTPSESHVDSMEAPPTKKSKSEGSPTMQ